MKKVGELKALLAKITHDECVTFIRKIQAKKHGGGNVKSLDEMLEAVSDVIVESHEFNWSAHQRPSGPNSDLVRLVMGLADQLNPKERQVFEDFHINKLTYKQISGKHGIPIGSVGVYLKRSHEKLRDLLGGMGEDFL